MQIANIFLLLHALTLVKILKGGSYRARTLSIPLLYIAIAFIATEKKCMISPNKQLPHCISVCMSPSDLMQRSQSGAFLRSYIAIAIYVWIFGNHLSSAGLNFLVMGPSKSWGPGLSAPPSWRPYMHQCSGNSCRHI